MTEKERCLYIALLSVLALSAPPLPFLPSPCSTTAKQTNHKHERSLSATREGETTFPQNEKRCPQYDPDCTMRSSCAAITLMCFPCGACICRNLSFYFLVAGLSRLPARALSLFRVLRQSKTNGRGRVRGRVRQARRKGRVVRSQRSERRGGDAQADAHMYGA